MCGRINVLDNKGVRVLLESLGMDTWPQRDPRFNIAPTQSLDTVLWQDDSPTLVPMTGRVSLTMPGKSAMFFAGLCRHSKDEAEKPEGSIVTTEANQAMSKVHDRMPAIQTSQNVAMAWFQEDDKRSPDELRQPTSNNAFKFTEVSSYINKSTNVGPECIEPIAA